MLSPRNDEVLPPVRISDSFAGNVCEGALALLAMRGILFGHRDQKRACSSISPAFSAPGIPFSQILTNILDSCPVV